jgi:hypothetical protein
MIISKPIKAVVGVSTLIIFLLPIGFILLWGFMALSMSRIGPITTPLQAPPPPFQAIMDAIFAVGFPLICFLNLLIYILYAFYVTHAIKNEGGADIIRIITLLVIFIFPYIGMPFYYTVYILLPNPPSWALKKQSTSIASSASI